MKKNFLRCIILCLILSCNNAQKNNPADKEKSTKDIIPVKIETRIFMNDTIAGSNLSGFGYDILVDGKPYIHQPLIPTVSGLTGFASEADARKTAEYVSIKLKRTGVLPALSREELDSLGIRH